MYMSLHISTEYTNNVTSEWKINKRYIEIVEKEGKQDWTLCANTCVHVPLKPS